MEYKTDFKRSDENSQDPLNYNFKLLEPLLEDTGWLPITLKPGYSWSSTAEGAFRVLRGVVYFRGQLAATSALGIFGSIPVEYAPKLQIGVAAKQASAIMSDIAVIYAKPTGELELVGVSNANRTTYVNGITYPLN